jgi:micrococcal nuclease
MPAKLIAALFVVFVLGLPVPARAEVLPAGEDATLVKVIDGDTITVKVVGSDAEVTVRYIGVDAPELATTRNTCFAAEATAANLKLVEGQTLRLEKDRSDTDRFGRLLRYVYLPDGQMVNEVLVLSGHAFSKAYRPDTRNTARFTAAQRKAQADQAGLWGACRVIGGAALPKPHVAPTAAVDLQQVATPPPAVDGQPVYTKEKGTRVRVTPEHYPCESGQIKGNRNSAIYHAPGMRDYAFTFKNVACFDTTGAAEEAGYRAAKR